MAVRRPVYVNGDGNIQEMTDSMITGIKNRCRHLYGANPSVTLSVVANGSGTLSVMSQTNMQAGAHRVDPVRFVSAANTPNVSVKTDTYDHISQSATNTTATSDTSNRAFPLYYTSGNLRSMSLTDMYDTFIYPAIDTLVDGTTQPGIYRIWNSSGALSGHSLVSSTPVFIDERANTAAYTNTGIPETLDQGTVINNYYLYRGTSTLPSITMPAKFDGTNITENWASSFDTILQNCMRHAASEITGHRIRYNINGTGVNKGTAMVDTRLNGSGNYQTYRVNTNDYRSQEFPNGTAVTISTYNLKVDLT